MTAYLNGQTDKALSFEHTKLSWKKFAIREEQILFTNSSVHKA